MYKIFSLRLNQDESRLLYGEGWSLYSADIYWVDSAADTEPGIPIAEDQLEVEVSYPSGGAIERPYNLSQYNDTFTIRSWVDNTLPAAYEISIYEPQE